MARCQQAIATYRASCAINPTYLLQAGIADGYSGHLDKWSAAKTAITWEEGGEEVGSS
ncbi:MAG TPA: hypothetical protein VFM10_04415 [Terriglobales bacterium]|nr:hypothetical protein [Terriglobales bacterium]